MSLLKLEPNLIMLLFQPSLMMHWGRRTSKNINNLSTSYTYDGSKIIQINSGLKIKKYLNGMGLDERFSVQDFTGQNSVKYYFLTDQVNSIL